MDALAGWIFAQMEAAVSPQVTKSGLPHGRYAAQNPDVTLHDSDTHSWRATGSFAVSIPRRTVRCVSSYFVGSLLWLQKQVVDRLSRCCHKTPRPVGWNVETSDQL